MTKKANPVLHDSDIVKLAAGLLDADSEPERHQILLALYRVKRINTTHYNGILRLRRGAEAWVRFMDFAEQGIAESKALWEEMERRES